MASIFTKIINGEIPCYKIAENDKFLAFLDINPLAMGHTLVIPKLEVDELFDINDEDLSELILFAKQVSHILKNKIECKRIGMSVIGLEVPHAHIHLVPLTTIEDINFTKSKLNPSSVELRNIQNLLLD